MATAIDITLALTRSSTEHGGRMFTSSEEVLDLHQERGCRVHRHPLHRPSRRAAALQRAGVELQRGLLHRGPDVRRLVDPRFRGDPQVRPEADPGPGDRLPRPVPQGQDAQHQPLDRRAAHRRAVRPRPAPGGHQGRGVPQDDRHRRHRLLRPRGRVLHLRRGPLRVEDERLRPTSSTPKRAPGTPAATRRAATSATRPASRAATSRSRRTTTTPTCATRSASS